MSRIEGFRVRNYRVIRDITLYPGGCQKLSKLPYQVRGKEKTTWAEKISPLMDIDNNQSPSFCYFRDQLRRLSEQ